MSGSMFFLLVQELASITGDDSRIRFFFDITFFIIVTTIGLNIVFGIIVDSFSELRDAKVELLGLIYHSAFLE